MHTLLHIRAQGCEKRVLRHRGQNPNLCQKKAKKFTNCKKSMSNFVVSFNLPEIFCEKPPKKLFGII